MSGGRPRTALGTFGTIHLARQGRAYRATTRYRDLDGRLRLVTATAHSRRAAEAELKARLVRRNGFGSGGVLSLNSPFADLCELWLADLELREISEGTKEGYRDDLRLHVRPFFANYTLGEITTGRVEHFLKCEQVYSYSRAKHSRNVLNQLFGFALRHDAVPRNPVEGTTRLAKPKKSIRALTPAQIVRIRTAAAEWRTGADVKGPRPDGQVRDALEVMLGTALRPGEVLALRPCDIVEDPSGMVVHVRGTVVYRTGRGTFRQDHPKTHGSLRSIPVPEFAADVLRRRLAAISPDQQESTILHNRTGGPLSQHNLRRTFREFLALAGLEESGITPRWYRRTGATVLARGLGVEVAAAHLGHTSTAITEGHYIEPDRSISFGPAAMLEQVLRPLDPDDRLLGQPETEEESLLLSRIDSTEGTDEVA